MERHHRLIFETEGQAAEALRDGLGRAPFTGQRGHEDQGWIVYLVTLDEPHTEEDAQAAAFCQELAARHGGIYDGVLPS